MSPTCPALAAQSRETKHPFKQRWGPRCRRRQRGQRHLRGWRKDPSQDMSLWGSPESSGGLLGDGSVSGCNGKGASSTQQINRKTEERYWRINQLKDYIIYKIYINLNLILYIKSILTSINDIRLLCHKHDSPWRKKNSQDCVHENLTISNI